MDNLELFTLLLAGATFLLALAAFGSIWQNHRLQKRERRERLLNEIIEWAEALPKPFVTRNFIDTQQNLYNEEKLYQYVFARFTQDLNHIEALMGRNVYILNISVSFHNDLQMAVQKLVEEAISYKDYYSRWYQINENNLFKPNREDVEKAIEIETQIKTSALDVINKATDIKTNDLC
jgi:hypothetical protein